MSSPHHPTQVLIEPILDLPFPILPLQKKGLGVKKVNAIKEKVIDNVERYLELEQFLGLTSTFENPLKDFKMS